MNHLLRELAPISDDAWAEIDTEAARTLTHFFAARRLVDFDGPLGYDASAVSLGRLEPTGIEAGPAWWRGSGSCCRSSSCIVRSPSTAPSSSRSTAAPATPISTRCVDACRALAMAEDTLVFVGQSSADIVGIGTGSPHEPIALTDCSATTRTTSPRRWPC